MKWDSSCVFLFFIFYIFFACAIWMCLEGLQLSGVSSKCGLNCLYTWNSPIWLRVWTKSPKHFLFHVTDRAELAITLLDDWSFALHPTFFQSIMQFLFPCCYDCMRQSLALEKAAASQGIKIKGEKNLHKPLKHTHYYGPCYLGPLENL